MKRTELLQEIRKTGFEQAHESWESGRLTQAEAARLLGVCERTFRRYLVCFEAAGLEGLLDRRLEQAFTKRAPLDETTPVTPTRLSIGMKVSSVRVVDALRSGIAG